MMCKRGSGPGCFDCTPQISPHIHAFVNEIHREDTNRDETGSGTFIQHEENLEDAREEQRVLRAHGLPAVYTDCDITGPLLQG